MRHPNGLTLCLEAIQTNPFQGELIERRNGTSGISICCYGSIKITVELPTRMMFPMQRSCLHSTDRLNDFLISPCTFPEQGLLLTTKYYLLSIVILGGLPVQYTPPSSFRHRGHINQNADVLPFGAAIFRPMSHSPHCLTVQALQVLNSLLHLWQWVM